MRRHNKRVNNKDRQRLDRFEEILLQHGERLARIEEQNRNQYHLLKEIKEQLFGNGQEGLIKTVARHKAYFAILGSAIAVLASIIAKFLF